MGLKELDGMDTPDNKGGRPTKDEQDEPSKRIAQGEPVTQERDSADWWEEKFNRFKDEGDTIGDTISEIAQHTFVHPIVVRKRLEDHNIHETDWDEYVEKYPVYKRDMRIQDRLSTTYATGSSSSSSSSSSGGMSQLFDDVDTDDTDDDDDDISGGLSSMIGS